MLIDVQTTLETVSYVGEWYSFNTLGEINDFIRFYLQHFLKEESLRADVQS